MTAVAYLDRVNISLASHYIVQEYHLSNIQLGYIFSAFVLGYALFQAPGVRLFHRNRDSLILAFSPVTLHLPAHFKTLPRNKWTLWPMDIMYHKMLYNELLSLDILRVGG